MRDAAVCAGSGGCAVAAGHCLVAAGGLGAACCLGEGHGHCLGDRGGAARMQARSIVQHDGQRRESQGERDHSFTRVIRWMRTIPTA